ncbi:hypothetical protein EFM21_00455 [Leuconostoc falkenbergense]|nr:hypothetical protein [Leuconostoc falkenbergense]
MKTVIIIIVYIIINTLIIYNSGNNFWSDSYMGLSVIFVYSILNICSKRKAKHDKYKEWLIAANSHNLIAQSLACDCVHSVVWRCYSEYGNMLHGGYMKTVCSVFLYKTSQ